MSELHPATRGFAAADVYERGRPDYPAAAIAKIVERLDLRPGRTVLDLAAGTGKLTRLLMPSGANVLAVEPVREMRAELERRVRGIAVLGGTAERIPLNDGYRRRGHGRPGVPLVRRRQGAARDPSRPASRAAGSPSSGTRATSAIRCRRRSRRSSTRSKATPRGESRATGRRSSRRAGSSSGASACSSSTCSRSTSSASWSGSCRSASSPPRGRDVRADVEERVRALARTRKSRLQLSYMTELYVGFAS